MKEEDYYYYYYYLPRYVKDGIEDARESESDSRESTNGEESGIS